MAKKLYFKIGEACKQLDIQPYVLRYWETEFPALSPDKSKSGQRVYSADDLEVIRRIKELLYDEGYTIAGAKKKLESELASGGPASSSKAKKPATRTTAGAKTDGPEAAEPPPEPSPKMAAKTEPAEPAALDSEDSEAKMLREGIQDALKEVRAILAILDSKSPAD